MSVVLGRVSFAVRHSPVPALERYGTAKVTGVPAVMEQSLGRVYDGTLAETPVGTTGHMQATLRREMAADGLGYAVGWSEHDFPAGGKVYTYATSSGFLASSAPPRIPAGFYPGFVVLGTRFMAGRDPMTPALEAERPQLLRELGSHFGRLA